MDDWFQLGLKRELGRGTRIKFWEDVWCSQNKLKDLFPRLYSISEDKDKVIEQLGSGLDENWVWSFNWRRYLFVWEQEVMSEFMDTTRVLGPMGTQNDVWEWVLEGSKTYSVK